MSKTKELTSKDKQTRVRSKPKQESVLTPTFAASRHVNGSGWDEHQAQGGGFLQRQCACGTHTIDGEECDACRQKHASGFLQRPALNSMSDRSQAVATDEVQKFSGSLFTYNFSQVPAHTVGSPPESPRLLGKQPVMSVLNKHIQRQQGGAPVGIPRSLEQQDVLITTAEGPTRLDPPGSFLWTVRFSLPRPAAGNGFIIQELRMLEGDPTTGSQRIAQHFWETWEVPAGARTPYVGASPDWDDRYRSLRFGASSDHGSYSYHGIVKFYEGPLPSEFGRYEPGTHAYNTYDRPAIWNGTGTRHHIHIAWDNRPGHPHYNRLVAIAGNTIIRRGF